MQAVIGFFTKIIGGIRALVGLVLPIFADAADFRNWPGWVRAVIGLLLLIGICTGLYFLQQATTLDEDWLTKVNERVRPFFLVAMFLLLVAFAWLAYGLWKLLTTEDEEIEFADIKEEWDEAVRRMAASGYRVVDLPLFLVLGKPAAGLDALFLAAGVKDIVRTPTTGAGGTGDPSIRVYAWDQAIFVVCPGASAWGRYCLELANPVDAGGWDPGGGAGAPPAGATLTPGSAFGGMDPGLRAEMEALLSESRMRDLSVDEQERLRELVDQLNATPAVVRKAPVIPDDDRVRLTRRLRYLCDLIRRDRRPWCPVNGVLTLVPWAATEANDLVNLGCGLLETELAAARQVFQMRYPTFVLVTDLETAPGYEEFRKGFTPEQLKARVGQRLPFVPVVARAEEVPGLLNGVARWIGLSVLPRWILQFLRIDGQDARKTPGAGLHNRRLYQLMRSVFDRGPRLGELLARGVPPVGGPDELAHVPMLGGVYLAATGRGKEEQAFVQGVFERVIAPTTYNAVSWSPEALEADARLNRLAMVGYIMLAVLVALAVAAVVLVK